MFEFMRRSKPSLNSAYEADVQRMSSFPFVTGDGFRAMCDRVWDENSSFDDLALRPLQGATWFCKSDHADELGSAAPIILPAYAGLGVTLVIHNGDVVPSELTLRRLLEHFTRVFVVNVTDEIRRSVGSSALHALPIGLENLHWRNAGRLDLYPAPGCFPLLTNWMDRGEEALACFKVETNLKLRRELKDQIASKDWVSWAEPTMAQEHYSSLLRQSRFVISPPGNGNDCHRTWGALYLGAIPVVLSDSLDSTLTEKLPILAVDSWSEFLSMSASDRLEVGNELLTRDRGMLDLGYWHQRIRNAPLQFA